MAAVDSIIDGIDTFIAWLSLSLKQPMEAHCDLETADSSTVLAAHDGSLASIIRIDGVKGLVGQEEFDFLHRGIQNTLNTALSHAGHTVQCFFEYDPESVQERISENFAMARQTAQHLQLDLSDLFDERVQHLSKFSAEEKVYWVLWTHPSSLTKEQFDLASKDRSQFLKKNKIPPLKISQDVMAGLAELRDTHDSFVRSVMNDLYSLRVAAELLEVHDALRAIRQSIDASATAHDWRPLLPGDTFRASKMRRTELNDFSDVMWPPLSDQLFGRDARIIDVKTVELGDRIYSTVFIDLFPKDIKTFMNLFNRALPISIPWRISYLIQSDPIGSVRFKSALASVLAFSNKTNRLLADSIKMLDYVSLNSDDSVVRLQVSLCTWAPLDNSRLLRIRTAELVKAVQGWGGCDVSQVCGDPFAGLVANMMGVSCKSVATPSLAPLADVVYMLPMTRPSSPWQRGALLFRTPDGKLWPYQPGSTQQTTWIDLIYARPGSGKSVLSNAINLSLCLSAGIARLPRIAIIDIGPSSSGLISLLKESLPFNARHWVAYHRLRMTPEYSVNPFDTQLGCRFPTPQERSFLVNFLTLLATPVGSSRSYDGVADMAGMIVDELYKLFADSGKPSVYAADIEPLIDSILEEMGFIRDQKTTWWEVTDALFNAGFVHEAAIAQRYAMPLLADASAICRSSAVEDLYRAITVPTGETLIQAFSRMLSGAVREYPILSRVTAFDLGDARVVSLDLDEVAKSGGDAADRQTAVMYMLARYVLAKNFYLTEENVTDMRDQYRDYHRQRIAELREDPKRIVYDEFHRTSRAGAVRDQVLVDMREGRKWNVQVALLSQSIEDFDSMMVEFATSIYIMDAGPAQTVEKTSKTFGLSETAQTALTNRVHGPRPEGATFLALFSTKYGNNAQLLTNTLGPIELWAFSTTAEDVKIRNRLYRKIGPKEARRVLARVFPNGSAGKMIESRMNTAKDRKGIIEEVERDGVVDQIINDLLDAYTKNPNLERLA